MKDFSKMLNFNALCIVSYLKDELGIIRLKDNIDQDIVKIYANIAIKQIEDVKWTTN